MPRFAGKDSYERNEIITQIYDSVRYDLMSIPFDPKARTFGTPRVEMDCAAIGRSATLPRVSPDGRYVLFTLGDFGQFHVWHRTADLWIKDLATGRTYPLTETNSPAAESNHTWSSNGRWMVFSSRRDDGSYTRPYIAYFDTQGRGHKAFILPQRDPEHHLLRLKSYNLPELTKNPVPLSPEELREVIYAEPTQRVSYRSGK